MSCNRLTHSLPLIYDNNKPEKYGHSDNIAGSTGYQYFKKEEGGMMGEGEERKRRGRRWRKEDEARYKIDI